MAKRKKLKSPRDINKYLDGLQRKLYNGLSSGKVTSKLLKGRKMSTIPGMGYFFKSK